MTTRIERMADVHLLDSTILYFIPDGTITLEELFNAPAELLQKTEFIDPKIVKDYKIDVEKDGHFVNAPHGTWVTHKGKKVLFIVSGRHRILAAIQSGMQILPIQIESYDALEDIYRSHRNEHKARVVSIEESGSYYSWAKKEFNYNDRDIARQENKQIGTIKGSIKAYLYTKDRPDEDFNSFKKGKSTFAKAIKKGWKVEQLEKIQKDAEKKDYTITGVALRTAKNLTTTFPDSDPADILIATQEEKKRRQEVGIDITLQEIAQRSRSYIRFGPRKDNNAELGKWREMKSEETATKGLLDIVWKNLLN